MFDVVFFWVGVVEGWVKIGLGGGNRVDGFRDFLLEDYVFFFVTFKFFWVYVNVVLGG